MVGEPSTRFGPLQPATCRWVCLARNGGSHNHYPWNMISARMCIPASSGTMRIILKQKPAGQLWMKHRAWKPWFFRFSSWRIATTIGISRDTNRSNPREPTRISYEMGVKLCSAAPHGLQLLQSSEPQWTAVWPDCFTTLLHPWSCFTEAKREASTNGYWWLTNAQWWLANDGKPNISG